jgi:signal transduction histidine kinase
MATLFKPGGSTSGGQGLGLSISRTIVEAHGGRMWAQNADDGGASFFFTLPRADRP